MGSQERSSFVPSSGNVHTLLKSPFDLMQHHRYNVMRSVETCLLDGAVTFSRQLIAKRVTVNGSSNQRRQSAVGFGNQVKSGSESDCLTNSVR